MFTNLNAFRKRSAAKLNEMYVNFNVEHKTSHMGRGLIEIINFKAQYLSLICHKAYKHI